MQELWQLKVWRLQKKSCFTQTSQGLTYSNFLARQSEYDLSNHQPCKINQRDENPLCHSSLLIKVLPSELSSQFCCWCTRRGGDPVHSCRANMSLPRNCCKKLARIRHLHRHGFNLHMSGGTVSVMQKMSSFQRFRSRFWKRVHDFKWVSFWVTSYFQRLISSQRT